MDFEWDDYKARSNKRKHQVDFADAISVLEDDLAMTIPDPHTEEERSVPMGLDSLGRVLVVVHMTRNESIRIISARNARPAESRAYHAQHWRTIKGT